MIYTVTLNPAIDCMMDMGTVVRGRVNRARSQVLRFSGKGVNVSYVLRQFGGKSVLTGLTAGFVGDALESGLIREGFACDFVRLAEGNTRINVKLTGNDSHGDPDTELNAPGPTPAADELQALTDKLSRLVPGDVAVLAGSLPAGVSADLVTRIADALHDGVSLVCDLSGDALRTALAASPDLVKPNVHELYGLLGIDATEENLTDLSLIENSARRLILAGARSALVTMGEGGAYFITESGECGFIPAPAAPDSASGVRSAVGCGDSTVAGWLIGMGFAGDDARCRAFEVAGIAPFGAESAARLAVLFGSASYYFGFPPSPHAVAMLDR